ncbi:O-acyltransferase WSD1 [Trifolium repens]|nr:O-acyltransferase WSD1 [Trifolium repens]
MCQQNYLCNVPNSSFPCIYIYLTLYYKLKHESIAIAKLKDNMEGFDDEIEEPVSPTGQYLNSSSLSVCILGVLESEIPMDDKQTMSLLQDVFLPINTRFSSIMIKDQNGEKKWRKVDVKLEEHVNIPKFPTCKSSSLYNEYMSTIAREHLPQNRPLWEIHIIKYPTKNAAGTLVFKLHHALGDGYSLMGALLSCLERADNPSLPFTLPSSQRPKTNFNISSVSFSMNCIKEVKSRLRVSTNDVIAGLIFFGIRLYMHQMNQDSSKYQSTALVLLNTRNISGYNSVKEMVDIKNNNKNSIWGNQFAFLHVSIPELCGKKIENPLEFIWEAHKEINRKKNSLATPLTGMVLNMVKKLRGPEATARFVYNTLRNSSTTISNIIGPVEQMALANHPVKGLYFMVVGPPESLTITIMSYMGKLRIAFGLEKDFIDKQKFISCMESSLEMIITAARKISK